MFSLALEQIWLVQNGTDMRLSRTRPLAGAELEYTVKSILIRSLDVRNCAYSCTLLSHLAIALSISILFDHTECFRAQNTIYLPWRC